MPREARPPRPRLRRKNRDPPPQFESLLKHMLRRRRESWAPSSEKVFNPLFLVNLLMYLSKSQSLSNSLNKLWYYKYGIIFIIILLLPLCCSLSLYSLPGTLYLFFQSFCLSVFLSFFFLWWYTRHVLCVSKYNYDTMFVTMCNNINIICLSYFF